MDEMIRVGFGRADITPEQSVPMGGYGNPKMRFNEVVRDNLYATCLAFTDSDDNTVLLYTTDAIRANLELGDQVREVLMAEMGLPYHHIMIASTHSHSTPELSMTDVPSIAENREKYKQGLIQAARDAMADRKPSEIFVDNVQTERMNFVRHYRMADGTYAGSNFGNWSSGIVSHASNPDPFMQLIKFVRQDGEDIILMNWQAHPCFTGGIAAKVLSADYIGEVRKYMEENTGAKFAFFQGAAGNHNARSIRKYETRTEDPADYGRLLGEYALRGLVNMRKLAGGKVAAIRRDITMQLDHSDDHLVPVCKEIWKEWTTNYDRNASNKQARAIGQNSIYAVGGVLGRATRGESEIMPIYALRVGKLGFACAPYEMFGVSGQYIKENSPSSMTFVVSCCNNAMAYLASKLAFSHGCYEVDTRRYPEGSAEMLAENFVDLLKELNKE